MSEKLQVTAEQHLALRDFFSFFKESPLKMFATHGKLFDAEYKSLKDLSIDQMAVAQFVGYEIERPKFEVGEWATRTKTASRNPQFAEGRTFKITELYTRSAVDEDEGIHSIVSIRHATKEEILWAELGRGVGEFVEGDVVIEKDGTSHLLGEYPGELADDLEFAKDNYVANNLKAFYPASAIIKLP